ncbi:MAG: Uma2 family endonuclease [Anaerolineales bacterium]|nr:Uma2 family endonuclease [Anaerolineales bacterium]
MVTFVAPQELSASDRTPKRIKMSYEEYLQFTTDAQIVEWVEGEAIVYMPPIHLHQRIANFLNLLISFFVERLDLGVVIIPPFEVKLWPGGPSREPDLIFISASNKTSLTRERFKGAPDLAIEIVSQGSATEDRVRKFTEYEKAGVREYWLIDPRPRKQQADFYVLGEDGFFHSQPIEDDGVYRSTVIPDFWFNVDWLFGEELPPAQSALAEIMLTHPNVSPEEKTAYEILLKAKRK